MKISDVLQLLEDIGEPVDFDEDDQPFAHDKPALEACEFCGINPPNQNCPACGSH